jgi:hypothetical protein
MPNASPINPRKVGQDFIASSPRNDAPRIAFIAWPTTDLNREVGELEHDTDDLGVVRASVPNSRPDDLGSDAT